MRGTVQEAIDIIVGSLKAGNKVITFGVGGNAANAIHFAAELAGKYEAYETPLPCIDLCSNPSILTAITNDFGWDQVFSRQLQALSKPGDVVLAFSISTGGRYLLNAIFESVVQRCNVILICGKCNLSELVEASRNSGSLVYEVGSLDTPRVQEEQLRLIHLICEGVKSRMVEYEKDKVS